MRAREMGALAVLTLVVVALATAIHLYHSHRVLGNATLREPDLVARQIYAKSARMVEMHHGGIQAFISKAQAALRARDVPRAQILADKASRLAEDLARVVLRNPK